MLLTLTDAFDADGNEHSAQRPSQNVNPARKDDTNASTAMVGGSVC